MEKNSEINEIIEKNDADFSGHSEKQIDLDVDTRTGQVQQQRRSQTVTQQAIVSASRSTSSAGKKKIITVFQKNFSSKKPA